MQKLENVTQEHFKVEAIDMGYNFNPVITDLTYVREGELDASDDDIDEGVDTSNIGSESGSDEETIISIGEDEFKLDSDGNAVAEDGTVKYSAEEIKKLEAGSNSDDDDSDDDDSDTDSFTIDDVAKITNIELTRDGKPLVFETSPEGFAKRELAVAEHAKNQGKQEAVEEYIASNPEISRVHKYLAVHGNLDNFNRETSYKDTRVDTNNVTQMSTIVRAGMEAKGNSSKQIESYLKYLVDTDNLANESKVYLKELQLAEKKQSDSIEQAYQEKLDAEKQAKLEFTTKISNTLNAGKVKGLTIPETFIRQVGNDKVTATRDELISYITTPAFKDNSGRTYTAFEKARLDKEANVTDEDIILEALGLFTGNDNLMLSLSKAKAKKDLIVKRRKVKIQKSSYGRVTGRVKDSDLED